MASQRPPADLQQTAIATSPLSAAADDSDRHLRSLASLATLVTSSSGHQQQQRRQEKHQTIAECRRPLVAIAWERLRRLTCEREIP